MLPKVASISPPEKVLGAFTGGVAVVTQVYGDDVQFFTSEGRIVDVKEAVAIAQAAGQISLLEVTTHVSLQLALAASSAPDFVVAACLRRKADDQLLVGPRHWDDFMVAQMDQLGGRDSWEGDDDGECRSEQGFVDCYGKFLTRREAYDLVKTNGWNVRPLKASGVLFSKDLY